MQDNIHISRLDALDPAAINALSEILIDCVDGGASVSFMHPLTRTRADNFWNGVAPGVAAGERLLLVAQDRDGAILGTVQVVLSQPENQPHRADVAKLLVHRKARRAGLGAALVKAAEHAAALAGKRLLVLDTVTGSPAEQLYKRLGWQVSGVIPDYALWPDGRLCATTVFYKHIGNGTAA
ncbi:GNAT family N-acetyltransferase [Collimonas fungivorans]|uniref:GNAT family N-acetyltransferase n=1 Tax=Collimonas fungivorans TaxID=158899 RepID=UPI003FA3C326